MIFQTFLQSKKWQDKDPSVRLKAIADLHHSGDSESADAAEAAGILAQMARKDPDRVVRLATIAHVVSLDDLDALRSDADEEIQHAALVQHCRVLSGAAHSPLDAATRIELMRRITEKPLLLAILHDCGCDETGLATLGHLLQEFTLDDKGLLDIAAHSNNHTVRLAAARHLQGLDVLEQLAELVKHKDKAVLKHCKEHLQAAHDARAKQAADEAQALSLCEAVETLAGKVIGALSQAQFDYKLSQWQEVAHAADAALQARFEAACASLRERIDAYAAQRQQDALAARTDADLSAACDAADHALAALTAPVNADQIGALEQHLHILQALLTQSGTPLDPDLHTRTQALADTIGRSVQAFHALEAKQADLDTLKADLDALTAKRTALLAIALKRLNKLFQKDAWPTTLPVSELYTQCLALETQAQKLLERNAAYLARLHQDSIAHIAAMEQHIEQGQVNDAQRMWDKVQGAIKNADDTLRRQLQDMLTPYKPRITELIDWKNFAATQKKHELIAQMQALTVDGLHAAEKAKKIKVLQDEWKALHHTIQNDPLWTQFNELSHKAFEPCKEYFKERKAKLHSNLEERNRICAQFEELLPTLTPETLNIAALNKLESKALDDWKLYAPVEQAKIKKLQKRFNNALNAVRQFKRKALQANASAKLALIAQAEALDAHENIAEALAEARKLQAQWKTIGPSPFKDDRNHWNAFRAACDKLFNKREKEPVARPAAAGKPAERTGERNADKARSIPSPAVAASKDILSKIRQLTALSGEELLQSRRAFTELKDAFRASLTADLKQEKRPLQEQFDKLCVLYESKLKAAPDKKSLQLIGQARAKADFCHTLEQGAMSGKALDAVDAVTEQWQGLGKLADVLQDQALEQRFHALTHAVDAKVLKRHAKDNEEKARELCISAEIHAGIDSPDADRALRLQVQLQQLKSSFGKGSGKSPAQLVADLDMQLLCLGPLDAAVRSAFEARMAKARARL
jgi:exonuclease SbcC